jgi:hypothetical protein
MNNNEQRHTNGQKAKNPAHTAEFQEGFTRVDQLEARAAKLEQTVDLLLNKMNDIASNVNVITDAIKKAEDKATETKYEQIKRVAEEGAAAATAEENKPNIFVRSYDWVMAHKIKSTLVALTIIGGGVGAKYGYDRYRKS